MDEAATIRPVSATAGEQLLDLADRAIVAGLDNRRPPVPDLSGLHADLRQARGAFVTLHVRGELNGCIGSIEGEEPLGIAVARHAWSAAFADPRLPPLRRSDHAHLEIEVSVLSPLVPLPADSFADLLDALQPGVDGLLIGRRSEAGGVPPVGVGPVAVGRRFRGASLRKAGLAPDVWPDDLRAHRFTARRSDAPVGTRRELSDHACDDVARWAGRLLALAALLLAAFYALVALGQRGGETFFSNPSLSVTILGAAGSAVAAGGFGVRALVHHERSVVVFVAIAVAVFVIWWISMEILFSH